MLFGISVISNISKVHIVFKCCRLRWSNWVFGFPSKTVRGNSKILHLRRILHDEERHSKATSYKIRDMNKDNTSIKSMHFDGQWRHGVKVHQWDCCALFQVRFVFWWGVHAENIHNRWIYLAGTFTKGEEPSNLIRFYQWLS